MSPISSLPQGNGSVTNLQNDISKSKTNLPSGVVVAPTVSTMPIEDMTYNQADE
jgi:hypothetical protein